MDEEIPYSELLVDVEDGIAIVFTNGRPSVWYFTSAKERCIKRKHRANISNATITDALAPAPKGADEPPAGALPPPGPAPGRLAVSHPPQPPAPSHPRMGAGSDAAGARPLDGSSTGTTLGPWPHHGVVARFQGSMTLPHTGAGGGAGGARTTSSGRRKKAQLELQDESVEWFTREALHEVLPPNHVVVHGVAALHEGVLQRFVQPRGQHHFSIRATWSPNSCVVERRTSKAKLNDPRVPLQDRLVAWDGPIWLTEHTLITGSVLTGTVCRLCDNVAAHLADVSGGAIRAVRMVLYFSVDDANRIWLTHCGTLKTQRPKEMALAAALSGGGGANPALHPHLRQRFAQGMSLAAALRLHVPGGGAGGPMYLERTMGLEAGPGAGPGLELPEPSPAFSASKAALGDAADGDGSGAGPSGRFLCVLTGEMYPPSQRCDVTYKQLLQHWFSLASQLSNEGDRLRAMDAIPLAIRRANPSLTREWYLRVRSQPSFLYRTAPVSAEAAGQLTGAALEDLQRSMRPPASGFGMAPVAPLGGGGAAAAVAALLAAQQQQQPIGGRPEGHAGGGGGGVARALSRQGTARSGPAALQPTPLQPTPLQRPMTAVPLQTTAGPASAPPQRSRPGSLVQPILGAAAGRGPVPRSKSASAATGAARSNSAPGGVGLSESGELPLLGAAGPGGPGSLNSTMASSVGSMASRRSTSTQALLSNDDMRTLRELSDAYTAAERLTQQLLAQAHEILSEDSNSGSRAGTPGTGASRAAAPGPHAGAATSSAGTSRPVSRHGGNDPGAGGSSYGRPVSSVGTGGGRGSSASGRPGGLSSAGQRTGGLGPSPLGQSQVSRQGSSGSRPAQASAGSGEGPAAAGGTPARPLQLPEPQQSESPVLLPPVAAGSGAGAQSAYNSVAPSRLEGSEAAEQGREAEMEGAEPAGTALLTSAEADLLAEALQN
ncbi:hypothetical protein GPECTOR_64g143 [Gonium pectorale]|uniref:Uncharacterized protein n=1 Tax=Gonium pectorale TaxID=33097 RepID=A0A150G432_GONPE|nr:hypothetical protein GPECTOR_64g143 [Gonium pectorale]|eukprot:KXZ44649.1 hypothetical protein GPECTOR_64g143 [Gonium pectorale]